MSAAEMHVGIDDSRFQVIFNTISEAIFLHDATNGRILDTNDAASRMYGYTRDEFMTVNIGQLSADDPAAAQQEALTRLNGVHTDEPLRFEWHARRKDGWMFWVEVTLKQVSISNCEYLLAVVTDISERKLYQQTVEESIKDLVALNIELKDAHVQLLQSEKMASLGQLAAGVAHEINNPVGYVISNIGSLEKYLNDFFAMLDAYQNAEPKLDEVTRASVERLRKELDIAYLREDTVALLAETREGVDRVRKIVKDLKDFSRAGAEDAWQWADLHAGLDSTLNIAWNELKYKTTVNKEYGELPQIWCLTSQINQVFMNLLVNAAHAIEKQGIVTIRTGQQGEEVWVEVEDTGSGIAPENMQRIFDPFFTTKPVGKGTGLGLAVSYSIVQKHHGRIEVKSEVGKGTIFRVWLPINPPSGNSEVVLSPTDPAAKEEPA